MEGHIWLEFDTWSSASYKKVKRNLGTRTDVQKALIDIFIVTK